MWMLLLSIGACDKSVDDSADTTPQDDSVAPDDSGTEKTDDSGAECTELEWFQDLDADGYGAGKGTLSCKSPGTAWVASADDCNDSSADVNPAAQEVCNGQDDDCDAAIDDKDGDVVATNWYPDLDGDGFGNFTSTVIASCAGVGGHAAEDAGADCDDADDSVYPGAAELCDDVQQDCDTKSWTGDAGVATWYPNTGGYEDWTAELADGKYGAAAKIEIAEDGELVICDGTWYSGFFVKEPALDVTITGLHGSEVTILDGGDNTRLLSVVRDNAVVTAQGLTMTAGNACYGAAVSTAVVSTCSSMGASAGWTFDVTLTLSDVVIEENYPVLPATAAVVVAQGTLFSLENTTIRNNNLWAVWAVGNPVICTGDAKSDAGVWGNTGGISLLSQNKAGTVPLVFESAGCDFEGSGGTYTPTFDIQLQNLEATSDFEFGDDAFVVCDANMRACAK